MPCPVCSKTMQNLGSPERRVFWCHYCGTLKEERGEAAHYELPRVLAQIVASANMPKPGKGAVAHTSVDAVFRVQQFGDEPTPRIEVIVLDAVGRRVV